MKKFFLATVLMLLAILAFSQERIAIAVFPFEDMDNLLTKNESVLFYRQFTNEFTNKNAGRFTIVPRQDVEKLFNLEEKFQLSDLSAKAKTAETQRVLNGTQVLSGVIGKRSNGITISVSLYTFPELGQLPGGVDISVVDKDKLFDKIPEIVKEMQNAIEGKTASVKQSYKVGDTGPAGGIIFYDRGFTGDGWRYLEAAPVSAEFSAEWGAFDTDIVNTMTAVGFGKKNTQIIVDQLNVLGEINRAAQICSTLEINGFKDWFLPSFNELDLMYRNLKQKGLGGFLNDWYWSSSQSSNIYVAHAISFINGYENFYYRKNRPYLVRAVRAF